MPGRGEMVVNNVYLKNEFYAFLSLKFHIFLEKVTIEIKEFGVS